MRPQHRRQALRAAPLPAIRPLQNRRVVSRRRDALKKQPRQKKRVWLRQANNRHQRQHLQQRRPRVQLPAPQLHLIQQPHRQRLILPPRPQHQGAPVRLFRRRPPLARAAPVRLPAQRRRQKVARQPLPGLKLQPITQAVLLLQPRLRVPPVLQARLLRTNHPQRKTQRRLQAQASPLK